MLRWLVLGLMIMMPLAANAEQVPKRRLNVERNVDYFGGDLQAIFDTDFESCQKTCLATPECTALTFNTRTGSCFPKTGVTEVNPYQGAMSARVIEASETTLSTAPDAVAELSFLEEDMFQRANALLLNIGVRHAPGDYSAEDYARSARDRKQNGDLVVAMSFMGSAIALSDRASYWVEYAELALDAAKKDRTRAMDLRSDALSAAINGYLYADNPRTKATALYAMARALEELYEGRAMIPALRLAQDLNPRNQAQALLEHAINRYGFRIIGNQVESELAEPRLCAEFSEPLVSGSVDYSTFVGTANTGLATEVDGQRLCMTGITHGSTYRITLREGLPAASGETLSRDVTLTMYVRDRSPSLSFSGRSYVLPRGADPAVPITTVNTDTIDLRLYHVSDRSLMPAIQQKLFGRPLNAYQEKQLSEQVGTLIWSGDATVGMEVNQNVLTRLPLQRALAGQPTGIYALQASIPAEESASATQWFVLSDMGLTSMNGVDGLHVFLRQLSTAAPRQGVKLTLLSRANAVLGTAVTNEDGQARFATGLLRGRNGAEPALILAEKNGDIGFLSLLDPEFDLSDRGVAGRAPSGPVDVFLATDRGAYRAGETIHLTAITRDEEVKVIWKLPLTAVLKRPDGVEYSRTTTIKALSGGRVFDLSLADSVPRGTWYIEVYVDPAAPPLATTKVLVEDFLPERFDYELAMPDTLKAGAAANLEVDAFYLFGAPAANLPIRGTLRVDPRTELDGYEGYVFGRHDERFEPAFQSLPAGSATDAEGMATVPVTVPAIPAADRPLSLSVTTQISEGSGRPVERTIRRDIAPSTPIIGIKPLFDGTLPENAEAAFDVRAIFPDGDTTGGIPAEWVLNRIRTTYQWYQLYGTWKWEPVTTRERIASGSLTLVRGATEIRQQVEWGQYELVVTRSDGEGFAATSIGFDAGWYAAADAASTPDTLELSLDKRHYKRGDTARLRLVPRYAGTALITVLNEGLIDMKAVRVREGENLIDLDVTDDWGTGAYVTASVARPMDVDMGVLPTRALGLAHARVDPGSRDLDLRIRAPKEVRPRAPLTVDLSLGDLPDGPVYATVAVVDEGILNVTGFQSPSPEDYFFGQRRLGVGIRDVYGRLIDSLNGASGTVRSGGDASGALSMQSPPPAEDLVSFFSGPVELDPDGNGQVTFDLPAYDGRLRVMAVAWSATGVASADTHVTVKDPVVISASIPRFLAPGDATRMLVEFTHTGGPSGPMPLSVTAGDALSLGSYSRQITLPERGRAEIEVPFTANETGDPVITISLTTPEGKEITRDLRMPVRANDPEVATTRRFELAQNDTFTLTTDIFANLRPGTGRAILTAGPLARFNAPALLSQLNAYPYGCTEQLTSSAMPLLYFDQVATALGLDAEQDLATRIDAAITEILTRQTSNGSFGLWYADNSDFWLDAYVTDFLTRADQAGHTVPDRALSSALDNLRNQVNYATDFDEGGQDIAYALMVLARAGAANIGDLRYYADVKADDFATPLAAAQLGAALATYGDQTRADQMFQLSSAMIQSDTEGTYIRSDYGTPLRDTAALLTLASESGSNVIDTTDLARDILQNDAPRSTQEAAWTLLAAHAMIEDPRVTSLRVDGHRLSGPMVEVIDSDTASPRRIRNLGSTVPLTLTTLGVPETPTPAQGYGYQITRKIYDLDANEITDGTFVSGQRYAVLLEVTPTTDLDSRLIINDPLSAGFEIDNPSLLRSGDVSSLSWVEPVETEMTQFLSDRFVAAVNWTEGNRFRLAYIVRAVTPGTYHAPAATVEDMYRPQYRAVSDTGAITVLK